MSDLKLFPAEFRGSIVHTLTVGGRPAWIAREIGAVLGYAGDGKRFVGKITSDWCDDLVSNVDFEILVGDDLAAVKAELDVISPATKGLVVLYESGLHMALVKTHMPAGRALRRFLVTEVLPQLVRTGAYTPTPTPTPIEARPTIDVRVAREFRLAAKVDLDNRKFRAGMLTETADVLFALDRIDGDTWAACVIGAAEIALGQPLPMLYDAATRGWLPPEGVAQQLRIPITDVIAIANVLGITSDRALALPVPTRGSTGWTVSFHFSPKAIAQIDAWVEDNADQRAA
jgi:prophage antirepressor-like protein